MCMQQTTYNNSVVRAVAWCERSWARPGARRSRNSARIHTFSAHAQHPIEVDIFVITTDVTSCNGPLAAYCSQSFFRRKCTYIEIVGRFCETLSSLK